MITTHAHDHRQGPIAWIVHIFAMEDFKDCGLNIDFSKVTMDGDIYRLGSHV